MTEEEIKRAKKRYNGFLVEKFDYELSLKKLKNLEKSLIIQEYLNLKAQVEKNKGLYSEGNMIRRAFSPCMGNSENSYGILVYMGAYVNDDKYMLRFVPNEDEADFVVYEDLETNNEYKVEIKDKEEFEEHHNTVYLNLEKEDVVEYKNKFIELKTNFFKSLLNEKQEVAVQKVLKRD